MAGWFLRPSYLPYAALRFPVDELPLKAPIQRIALILNMVKTMISSKTLSGKIIKQLSVALGLPKKNNDKLIFCSTNDLQSEFVLHVGLEKKGGDIFFVESYFGIKVYHVSKLLETYSGRPAIGESFLCSLQIRNAVFPEYQLPDWHFSIKNDDVEIEKCISILNSVILEKIIPLANRCATVPGLLDAVRSNDIQIHLMDKAMLFYSAGQYAEAKTCVANLRSLLENKDRAPQDSRLLLTMIESLAKDIAMKIN